MPSDLHELPEAIVSCGNDWVHVPDLQEVIPKVLPGKGGLAYGALRIRLDGKCVERFACCPARSHTAYPLLDVCFKTNKNHRHDSFLPAGPRHVRRLRCRDGYGVRAPAAASLIARAAGRGLSYIPHSTSIALEHLTGGPMRTRSRSHPPTHNLISTFLWSGGGESPARSTHACAHARGRFWPRARWPSSSMSSGCLIW